MARSVSVVVEHALYVANGLHNANVHIRNCNLVLAVWENYNLRERPHIFSVFEYNFLIAACIEVQFSILAYFQSTKQIKIIFLDNRICV